MRFAQFAAVLAAAACPAFAQDAALGDTTIHFASLPEARAALSADDEWVATTSNFQRQAILGSGGDIAPDAFRRGMEKAAQECTPDQVARWSKAVAAIAPRFKALKVALPPRVMVACTDGTDSANAPYTRAATVFLSASPNVGPYSDAELMAHELFHVLTRSNPELATRLYAALGFQPTAPLAWPAEWAGSRLSNPDAPHHRHYMTIGTAQGPIAVMPVLVARRTALAPGETFFSVLDVRLLEVTPGEAGRPTEAVRRNGQLAWLPAMSTQAYLQRLGGNTFYVFHPEETAADNFAFLVSGRQVRNPRLLEEFEGVLGAAGPASNQLSKASSPP